MCHTNIGAAATNNSVCEWLTLQQFITQVNATHTNKEVNGKSSH